MAVQPQTPHKEYIANGSTTSFALEFDCENQNHLVVLVDGIEPVVGTWSLIGGAVVFGTAPISGKKITVQRNTPFRRDEDFQSHDNSFRPGPVNKGLDKVWLKLQELGVADWILSNRIDALKSYVNQQDGILQDNIDSLKNYVDDKDDELRNYLLNAIQEQGVALDQLEEYYSYLMQQLAQVAIDRGWAASFIVSADGSTQQEINDFGGAKWRNKPLGYDIGSTVKLENGDIVKNTVPNNTANPDIDMTGWVNTDQKARSAYELIFGNFHFLSKWGPLGDGVTQDRITIQAAIDQLHNIYISTGVVQSLIYSDNKTYVCHGILVREGVNHIGLGSSTTLLKTPALPGEVESSLKFRNIYTFETVSFSSAELKDRIIFDGLTFDGNYKNMNWTFNTYNQEQGASLKIFNTSIPTGKRLKIELRNMKFKNSVADGVLISHNIDVIGNNIELSECFRGGIVHTGGNTIVAIDNVRGENANIHIEIDYLGWNTKRDLHANYSNVTLDAVNKLSATWGGFYATPSEGSVIELCNFKCYSEGFYVQSGYGDSSDPSSKITGTDCVFHMGGNSSTSVVYAPSNLYFTNSEFYNVSGTPEFPTVRAFDWYWRTASITTTNRRAVFNGCKFISLAKGDTKPDVFKLDSSPDQNNCWFEFYDTSFEGFAKIFTAGNGVKFKLGDGCYLDISAIGYFCATNYFSGSSLNIEIGRIKYSSKMTKLFAIAAPSYTVNNTLKFDNTEISDLILPPSGDLGVFTKVSGVITVTSSIAPNKAAWGVTYWRVIEPILGTPFLYKNTGVSNVTTSAWRPIQWAVKSGNTAGRPTLAANDVGVNYINTETSKNEVWTGSAWI